MNPRTTLMQTTLVGTTNPRYRAFITKLRFSDFEMDQDQKTTADLIIELFRTLTSKWVAPASDRKPHKTVLCWITFKTLSTKTLN